MPLRFLVVAFILSSLSVDRSHAKEKVGWGAVESILQHTQAPIFAERDFHVTDYGAKPDGKTDCHAAFAAAIKACHQAGGGRVVAPAGVWLCNGPVHLLSNVNLHLEQDAVLRFGIEPADYEPLVYTRFEGTELMNYSPLIYAFEQENIALTGQGTIDGQAGPKNWWKWKGQWGGDVDHGWRPGDADQTSAIEALRQQSEDRVPTADRVYGEGANLRPNFVQPYRCKNVLIEGVTVRNSPMWCLHPVLCENVTVRGVTVDSHGPNNDGCNPESCKWVLIEDCVFDTGDDCIAIKSGRNEDGRSLGRPSEYYLIRNCTMRDGHGGVVLGSEMSGGVRNIFVEDCRMSSPHLERAIRLKSNSLRGGFLENLFVRNIEVGQVSDAVVRINLYYFNETGDHDPLIRNIYVSNVTAKKAKYAFYLRGLASRPIQNVVVEDCTFEKMSRPSIIENVDELVLRNVTIPGE